MDLDARQLIDSAGDAIVVADAKGSIVFWNGAAERILGWKEEEILGQDLARIFTPEDRAAGEHLKELETAAASG